MYIKLWLLSASHRDDAGNMKKMPGNKSHLDTFLPLPACMSGKVSNSFQRTHLLVFKNTEERKKSAVIHFVIQAFTLFLLFLLRCHL